MLWVGLAGLYMCAHGANGQHFFSSKVKGQGEKSLVKFFDPGRGWKYNAYGSDTGLVTTVTVVHPLGQGMGIKLVRLVRSSEVLFVYSFVKTPQSSLFSRSW